MPYKDCVVTDKKSMLDWLTKLPDDAIVIRPVCDVLQLRASSKRKPNMRIDIAFWMADDLFQRPDDIGGLEAFGIIPFFWIRPEKAKSFMTTKALGKNTQG